MSKKVVQYTRVQFFVPGGVGGRAFVTPVDHPDTINVTNGQEGALTTEIVAYDEATETFETQNTVYVPA